METRETEIWKPIPDYEGLYEVSSWGNLKSLSKKVKGSKSDFIILKERILKKQINTMGYYHIDISKDGKRKIYLVNILVGRCFLDNYDSSKVINHIDKNPLNNYYKNLELINQRENVSFSVEKANCSSKLIGVTVSYQKIKGQVYKRIGSQIHVNKKKIWLGSFKSEEDAHQAYLNALKEYGLVNKYATESQ